MKLCSSLSKKVLQQNTVCFIFWIPVSSHRTILITALYIIAIIFIYFLLESLESTKHILLQCFLDRLPHNSICVIS